MLVARKSVHFWHIAGVCVSTAGLWLFTNPDFNNLNLGDLITVVSTFFWAFYITYMDIFTKNVRDIAVTKQLVFMQFVVTVPIGFLFFILFELSNFYINITPVLLSSLFYNGIIASIILTLIHTSVQKYTTPVKAALIFALEPVFAASIAFFVISEKLSVLESAGAAILLSGVLVSEFGDFILGWLSGFFLRK
jgi:drug/metabolite transporter (DMT)-like permease